MDGVYQFSIYACGAGAYSKIELLINDAWDGLRSMGGTSYVTQGATIIRQLSAGDTVKPYAGGGEQRCRNYNFFD